jgi:hypothetical protein
MASSDDLVEQWFTQTLQSYPQLTTGFLASEKDRFRNPVGHALRNGMAVLVAEILGEMKRDKVAAALDAIVRIRAVQDFMPSEAVGFVFLARAVLLGSNLPRPAMIEARIDQLALMAFDQYMKCREQIAEVRANETRRRTQIRPALRHR